jgi:hypothetical protein
MLQSIARFLGPSARRDYDRLMRPSSHALVVCALALTGCNGGVDAAAEAKQLDEAKHSWAGLSRCLVGAPLDKGEKASQRMLMSEIALLSVGKDAKKAGDGWPGNCDKVVEQLLVQLEALKSDAAVEKFALLQEKLRMAKGISPALYISNKEEPLADALWTAATAAGFEPPAAPAKKGPSAPKPAQPVSADLRVLLGESDGLLERTGAAPGDRVSFMMRGDKSTFFCSVSSNKGPLDSASCQPLERQPSILAAPASATTDARYYFDTEPKPALWTPAGESIEGPFGPSTYVYDTGMIADVTTTRTGLTLTRYMGSGAVKKAGMPKVVAGKWLGFRAGAALWRGPKRGTGKRPVIFHEVITGKVPVTGRRELGEVPPDVTFLDACRSGDTLVVALLGEGDPKKPEVEPGVSMVFRMGEDWKSAQSSSARFDTERPWHSSLSCSGKEGVFSWLEGDKVGQIRCTPEGCNKTMSADLGLGKQSVKARVADLNGNALLVRVHRAKGVLTGATDTVLMRFGPVAKLAQTPDEVLVVDDKHGGFPQLNKGLGLITSDGAALALIHSADKVFGVRINAKGKPSKLQLGAAAEPAPEAPPEKK